MTKRDQLHEWLYMMGQWMYLQEIPHEQFNMSKAGCSTALRNLCEHGRADFRVVGLKQYKANNVPPPGKGPKQLKRSLT